MSSVYVGVTNCWFFLGKVRDFVGNWNGGAVDVERSDIPTHVGAVDAMDTMDTMILWILWMPERSGGPVPAIAASGLWMSNEKLFLKNQ